MKTIKTKIATEEREFEEVKSLISEMYSWRGYHIDKGTIFSSKDNCYSTIISYENGEAIGTFSMIFDNPNTRFNSDYQYSHIIEKLRENNEVICEISKLATSSKIKSKRYIAYLFSILYMSCKLHNVTSIIIEVNPRHEDYYKKMLGFESLDNGECERVKAPGILMRLNLEFATEQIQLSHSGIKLRNLYNLFLNKDQMENLKKFLMYSQPCEFPSEEFILEMY